MVERMKYRRYKQYYSDCETVFGTYDKATKTIEVEIPDGRMKPSGVRGQRFSTYWLSVGESPEKVFTQGFKATSLDNAIKQAKRGYKYVTEN